MQPEAIFEAWAPAAGVWSLWARPVLFAQMSSAETPGAPVRLDVTWAPESGSNSALVLDLPGEDSVRTGLALAERGYRPVPLYNACTGPREVIDQQGILRELHVGAGYLPTMRLPADAPPAFLLDALRLTPREPIAPGVFDNRWMVFPQDFPSARFLIGRGVPQVWLIQRGRREPQNDLAHILRRWQDAGLAIKVVDVSDPSRCEAITVEKPRSYREIGYRVNAAHGLHRSWGGGFGTVVPEPSHG